MDEELRRELIARLDRIEGRQIEVLKTVAIVESKAHTPDTCPAVKCVKNSVNTLKLHEARQGGILAVIGVIAGAVSSVIVGLVIKFFSK